MKIKEVFLAVFAAIGTFCAAVFYVLFQQKKDENMQLQLENERREKEMIKGSAEHLAEVSQAIQKNREEKNEEVKRATGGNTLVNARAGLDILRK